MNTKPDISPKNIDDLAAMADLWVLSAEYGPALRELRSQLTAKENEMETVARNLAQMNEQAHALDVLCRHLKIQLTEAQAKLASARDDELLYRAIQFGRLHHDTYFNTHNEAVDAFLKHDQSHDK